MSFVSSSIAVALNQTNFVLMIYSSTCTVKDVVLTPSQGSHAYKQCVEVCHLYLAQLQLH